MDVGLRGRRGARAGQVRGTWPGARRPRPPLLVLVAIGAQIAVPAIALANDPPTRFGFQMYSGLGGVPRITLVDSAGDSRSVPTASVVAKARPEIDWTRHLPQYLCGAFPGTVTVRLETATPTATATSTEYACQP